MIISRKILKSISSLAPAGVLTILRYCQSVGLYCLVLRENQLDWHCYFVFAWRKMRLYVFLFYLFIYLFLSKHENTFGDIVEMIRILKSNIFSTNERESVKLLSQKRQATYFLKAVLILNMSLESCKASSERILSQVR